MVKRAFLISILIALGAISLSVSSVVLLASGIYRLFLQVNSLWEVVGLTYYELMDEFRRLMAYLIIPTQHQLNFVHFTMSEGASIHFAEVKELMQWNFVVSMSVIVIGVCTYLWRKDILSKRAVLLHTFLLYMMILPVILFVVIDFDSLFILFHQVFFRNDLWLFNPMTDPIINVLPQSLFLVYGIIIFVIYELLLIAVRYGLIHLVKEQ